LANPWVVGPEPERIQRYGNHPDQLIEFFGSAGHLVAAIHGGYWRSKHNREHMRALSAELANSGFQVANIEYRRETQKPEETFADVQSALQTLENLVAVIGFSVGGQLALLNSEVAHKLILLAPVTDLGRTREESLGENAVDEFFGDTDIEPFDPIKINFDSHIYIIHGDADQRVPITHSRDFVKEKSGSLTEIAGADHFDVINPQGLAFELILRALA
jgi:acetyl esterase/lipase